MLSEVSLPTKAIKIWKVRATILMCILFFVCGGLFVFNPILPALIIALVVTIYVYIITIYCRKRYNSEKYYIGKNYILLKKGVFFKKEIKIYRSQVRQVRILQTPDQRLFGMSTLVFYLAGKSEKISQIELKDAITLQKKFYFGVENEV